jgi:hypothetical protein
VKLVADDDGLAVYEYTPESAGAQELTAEATLGKKPTSETEVFVVTEKGDELREVSPRADLIKALAEATGGSFHQLPGALSDDDAEALALKPPRVTKVNRRREEPLWSSTPFLLAPILLLCAEWWLRRRWGYA